jgi:hypothetical protein
MKVNELKNLVFLKIKKTRLFVLFVCDFVYNRSE